MDIFILASELLPTKRLGATELVAIGRKEAGGAREKVGIRHKVDQKCV